MTGPRTCIGCDCTEVMACRGGCFWAYKSELQTLGICSNCVADFDEPEEALLEVARECLDAFDPPELDIDDRGLMLPGDAGYAAILRGIG